VAFTQAIIKNILSPQISTQSAIFVVAGAMKLCIKPVFLCKNNFL